MVTVLNSGRQPVLETARLVLRPYEASDIEPMAAMFDDPEVTAFTFLGRRNRAQTQAVLDGYIGFLSAHGYGMLAIVDRATGGYLGEAGLFISPMGPPALRYALVRSGWGRGYAVEASAAVIGDAFGRLDIDSLIAGIKAENAASLRVADKLGFVYTETITESGHTFGVFTLSREIWSTRSH